MSDQPTRAYYVDRPARTVTTFFVYADSAKDAIERVNRGESEWVDSETVGKGSGVARRSPEDDR